MTPADQIRALADSGTPGPRDWMDYPRGTVAMVEGRLAVLVRAPKTTGRWDWLDGTWTSIPIVEPVVLGNVNALPKVADLIEAIDAWAAITPQTPAPEVAMAEMCLLAARDALTAALGVSS